MQTDSGKGLMILFIPNFNSRFIRFVISKRGCHIPSFLLTTTIVKPNIENKLSATNARPPGPQATSTSVGESLDSLNLISCASSRAGKYVHPKGRSRTHRTIRRFFRSVSAAEDSRKASSEPSSSSEEEESEEEEVNPGPRTPTASRIITSKLSHRIAPFQLLATPSSSAPEGRTHFISWNDQVSAEESRGLAFGIICAPQVLV